MKRFNKLVISGARRAAFSSSSSSNGGNKPSPPGSPSSPITPTPTPPTSPSIPPGSPTPPASPTIPPSPTRPLISASSGGGGSCNNMSLFEAYRHYTKTARSLLDDADEWKQLLREEKDPTYISQERIWSYEEFYAWISSVEKGAPEEKQVTFKNDFETRVEFWKEFCDEAARRKQKAEDAYLAYVESHP